MVERCGSRGVPARPAAAFGRCVCNGCGKRAAALCLCGRGFAAGYAYEIDSIRFVSDGKPVCLKLVSPEAADVCAPGWRDGAQTGLPVYAVQGDGKLTLAPAPDRDGRLFAGGIACRGIWRGTGTSRKSIPYIIGIWFIGLWRRLSVSRMRRLSTRSVRNRQGGVSSCISACRPTVICAVSRVRMRRT